MEPLSIKNITINNSTSSVLSIKANQNTPIRFVFNRALNEQEHPVIRCELHDAIFEIDYYLLDVEIKRFNSPTGDYGTANLSFPEELAGATLEVKFLLKKDIFFLDAYTELHTLSVTKSVEIKSAIPGTPLIHDVYWGVDDSIVFGKPSPKRADTDAIGQNENICCHIHTRGFYGGMVSCQLKGFSARKVKVKNNTCIYQFSVPLNINSLTKTIEVTVSTLQGNSSKTTSATLDKSKVTPVKPKTSVVYSSIGKAVESEKFSSAKCRIDFRPTSSYCGEFGFSWFRIGDMKYDLSILPNTVAQNRPNRNMQTSIKFTSLEPCNDQPFEQIMGYHYETINGVDFVVQNGNNSSIDFREDMDSAGKVNLMAQRHSYDYSRICLFANNSPYYIPMMTIQEGTPAELQIYVQVYDPAPEKIYFTFDNPNAINEGYMSVDITEIKGLQSNKNDYTTYKIKIECKKAFSKCLFLEAWAVPKTPQPYVEVINGRLVVKPIQGVPITFPQLCGAVKILPNDVSHQRKIKVVFFNIKTMLNGKDKIEGLDGLKNRPSINDAESALKKHLCQAYVNPDIVVENIDLIDQITNITDSGYTNCCIPDPNNINEYLIANSKNGVIEDFLATKVNPKYNDCFKIFFIPDKHQLLNGFSSGRKDKFTICFYDAMRETPAHELLHALGLPHTFDGSTSRAKYVYEDGMTDNLMDYSHLVGINRQSLFHWQWKAINIKL